MSEPKELISLAVSRARAELDEALHQLEKLPAASASAVGFAAHALNPSLTHPLHLVVITAPSQPVTIGISAW